MENRLAKKVVLVTGSTKGIGRGIALQCAAEGARVTVTGRTESAGREVVARIEERGGEACFIRTDVTVEEDVAAAVYETVKRWGALDGLVCNAAALELGARDGPITEITLDGWNDIINVDLTSVFLSAKHGIRAMIERDGGSVVLISSFAALRGVNGMDAYTAAKGGVLAMTRSIASYYSRYDVRCNCLGVGFVDSGSPRIQQLMESPEFAERVWTHHLGRLGTPADVASVAAHLVSDESGYITGAVIPVDGGATAASHLKRPSAPDLPGYERKRIMGPQF